MPLLSVIIPFKNEEANILPLARKMAGALSGFDHELIWVDDGSTDDSNRMVRATGKGWLITLDQNYGQSIAMKAGIDHSKGRFLVFLDADGQNDPCDIPRLLQLIQEQPYDMVAGLRINRHDSLGKKIPSAIANWLIRALTGIKNRDLGCTLKIFKRETALRLPLYKGMHRFIPVLVKRMGGSSLQVPVRHHPRVSGKSKNGMERIFFVTRDLLTLMVKRKIARHPSYSIRSIYVLENAEQDKARPVLPLL